MGACLEEGFWVESARAIQGLQPTPCSKKALNTPFPPWFGARTEEAN